MADGFKKAAVWLGLMADTNSYQERASNDDEELTEEVRVMTREANQGAATVTELEPRRPTPIRPIADVTRITTVTPRTFNDAKGIGENFRDGIPVIMNVTDMDETDARRLVDFASGLIFGLHGTIERVTNKVFLLCPANVTVGAEDKKRIAGGFFNQS